MVMQAKPPHNAPTPAMIADAVLAGWTGRQSDAEVAAGLGISRRTLARWKHRPEWVAAAKVASVLGLDLLQWKAEAESLQRRYSAKPSVLAPLRRY